MGLLTTNLFESIDEEALSLPSEWVESMEGKSISEGPTRRVLTASVWSVCVGVG